ncbi:MAG: TIM barrel protein [Armatimonadetes bacterium]|nr:TIM barrel protein [Armatimonadota bacterium]
MMVTGALCVCLDAVFGDAGPLEALAWIAALGLRRFEFWDWRPRDVDALARRAGDLGLEAVIFSGNTFDEPLVDADAHGRALDHFARSLQVARRLGVRLLVAHVGYAVAGRSRAEQWTAAVAGLRRAGALAAASGVTLAVEPLNSAVDHPGYFLDTLPGAVRLIDEVGHPAVRLLLDVYHMRVMHEDLLERLPAVVGKTVHVHVADVPGRREPGTGAIAWPEVLRFLRGDGYRGAIGLECWPSQSSSEALRRSAEVLRP